MAVPITKIVEVTAIANTLFKEHGLTELGWTFKLDSSKKRVGQCRYRKREIGLSLWFIEKTPIEKLKDTILHEIAHVLVGPNHGHDDTWKAMCIRIGAEPTRLGGEHKVTAAKPNYVIRCPGCGWEIKRYRMRRRNLGGRCPKCGTEVEIYKITYKPKEG